MAVAGIRIAAGVKEKLVEKFLGKERCQCLKQGFVCVCLRGD